MKKRKFLILFLETGGGHKAAANVLKSLIEERYPGSEAKLVNGLKKQYHLANFVVVDFYHISMNFFSALYSFVYRIGNNYPFVRIAHLLLQRYTIPYLRKVFDKEQPTDIINLHFGLESPVRYLLRKHPSVRATTIVLDPFSAHSSWFYDKKANYFVFSERVHEYAVKQCKIPEENIKVVPFILNQKYLVHLEDNETKALKQKYGVSPEKKVVLLAGGGEGLPVLMDIVKEFSARKVDFTIIAVCGRNITAKAYLDVYSKISPIDLRVFGFVNFMDELVKICDCAVIKAGPASLMEVLASKKPVVICDFIYGQELGNVQFAVDNGFGKFCRKPSDICDAVDAFINDEQKRAVVDKRLSNVPISFETGKVIDSLFGSTDS